MPTSTTNSGECSTARDNPAIENQAASSKPGSFFAPLSWAAGLAAASIFLASVIKGSKVTFWFDEFLTNMLVHDPSLGHMLHAMMDKTDASPPLYYICAWCWVHALGGGELTLRVFTAFCMAGAFFLAWRALRRGFGGFAALWGVLAAFALSRLVRDELEQVRCYGIFLFFSAAAFNQCAVWGGSPPKRWRWRVANTLVHAGLVSSHNYGILMSGSILATFFLAGLFRRKLDWLALASVVAGWVPFLLWLPATLQQSKISLGRNWIPMPTLMTLIHALAAQIHLEVAAALLVVLAAAGFIGRAKMGAATVNPETEEQRRASNNLLLTACGLFLVPVGAFIISHASQPILYVRYLIPLTLSYAVFFAAGLAWIFNHPGLQLTSANGLAPSSSGTALQRACAWAMMLLMAAYLPACAVRLVASPDTPVTDQMFAAYDMPVVFESGTEYLHMRHYSRTPAKYYMVKDLPATLASTNLTTTTGYSVMSAIQRNYPQNQIYESADFLRQFNRFLLYDDPSLGWMKCNLPPGGPFAATFAGRVGERSLYICERKPGAPRP